LASIRILLIIQLSRHNKCLKLENYFPVAWTAACRRFLCGVLIGLELAPFARVGAARVELRN
jgi:hypothetical protein